MGAVGKGIDCVGDYARLTGLSRSAASRELRGAYTAAGSQIKAVGRGPSLVYVLRDAEEAVE